MTASTQAQPDKHLFETGSRKCRLSLVGWLHAAMRTGILTVLWVFTPVVGHTQQVANTAPSLFSQGDPTAEEQYLLEKLNQARMDPVGEGKRLAAWLTTTEEGQSVIAYYQTDPNQVIADFAVLPAVPPLAFNADLLASSRGHSADLAAHDGLGPGGAADPLQNHIGYDGSTSDQRVYASGYRDVTGGDGFAGENYDPGQHTLDEDHAAYLVDWGNPDLGHRKNSMQGTYYNVCFVGIGVAHIPTSVEPYHNIVTTEDFGGAGIVSTNVKPYMVFADAPAYLTGVVYADGNANDQYDVGEGVAGATVTMDGGAYYTVTSASGGYALPLVHADGTNADGIVTVHLTGLPGGVTRDATITVPRLATTLVAPHPDSYRANVKWDAVLSGKTATLTPADPTEASIAGGGSVAKGGKLLLVVSRPATQSDHSQPLTLAYTLKGSAVADIDYQPLSGSVTIPAGKRRAKLTVQALDLNVINRPAGTWTLQLKLRGVKGAQGKASVTFAP